MKHKGTDGTELDMPGVQGYKLANRRVCAKALSRQVHTLPGNQALFYMIQLLATKHSAVPEHGLQHT